MLKLRRGAAALALLLTLTLTASAQATPTTFTSSNVTSPVDGTLEFQNIDTNPNATITIAGTTNWTTTGGSNLFDIGCYAGSRDFYDYAGSSGTGIALDGNGNFSVVVPQATFKSGTCHLVVVPHGTSTSSLPSGSVGPRVGFSYFQTAKISSGANSGTADDFNLDDVTTQASTEVNSIDDCGPYTYLLDGTSAMNYGPSLFYCAGCEGGGRLRGRRRWRYCARHEGTDGPPRFVRAALPRA